MTERGRQLLCLFQAKFPYRQINTDTVYKLAENNVKLSLQLKGQVGNPVAVTQLPMVLDTSRKYIFGQFNNFNDTVICLYLSKFQLPKTIVEPLLSRALFKNVIVLSIYWT